MSSVQLKNINKIYDNNVQAVFDFNLDIKDGEFIVLVGPSGCGKSTTLRMIAGLEEISTGELYIDGVFSNDLLPKNRDTAMVFQNYALYPHMTVYENMAFGLKNRKVDKETIDKRIREAAEILGITEYLERKPKALSGGQCQRVALGRAIVRQAKAFLMDEPLSNLDAKLRVQMRSEIIKLHKRIGSITIYVTHDQTEAMTMADRIVVMSKGYIQQIGAPKEIYNHPKNLFVAGFIGSPSMNFLKANTKKGKLFLGEYPVDISKEQAETFEPFYKEELKKIKNDMEIFDSKFAERNEALEQIALLEQKETLNANEQDDLDKYKKYVVYLEEQSKERTKIVGKVTHLESLDYKNSDKFIVGIRPEDIVFSLKDDGKHDYIPITVGVVELLGHNQIVHFEINGQEAQVEIDAKTEVAMDQQAFVYINPKDIHLFDAVTEDALF